MNASIAVCAIACASSYRSFWKMPTCSNITAKPRRPKKSRPLRPTRPSVHGCALSTRSAPPRLDDVGVEAAAQPLVAGDDDHAASGCRRRGSRAVSSGWIDGSTRAATLPSTRCICTA